MAKYYTVGHLALPPFHEDTDKRACLQRGLVGSKHSSTGICGRQSIQYAPEFGLHRDVNFSTSTNFLSQRPVLAECMVCSLPHKKLKRRLQQQMQQQPQQQQHPYHVWVCLAHVHSNVLQVQQGLILNSAAHAPQEEEAMLRHL